MVPVVMFGNVFAMGFGWELFVVEVLALARKAASSAGVRPASNWLELINEGRVLSWSSSWITAGGKGGSSACA